MYVCTIICTQDLLMSRRFNCYSRVNQLKQTRLRDTFIVAFAVKKRVVVVA